MTAFPPIDWPHFLVEILEFAGAYLAVGAIGFRYAAYAAARQRHGAHPAATGSLEHALRLSAIIGSIGSLLTLRHIWAALPAVAERQHTSVAQVAGSWNPAGAWLWLTVLALIGFGLAIAGRREGWMLALLGVVAGTLRAGLFGQWERLLKPGHLLAGGLWIGTLFVLVAAGLATVMSQRTPRDRRGALAADLVHGFSPLALVAAGALALLGAMLTWRELPNLAALWTTPYGRALVLKLVLAGVVFGLGAWNWKRQKPRLGDEAAAASLRSSAGAELAVAFLVILATGFVAGMPSPKP